MIYLHNIHSIYFALELINDYELLIQFLFYFNTVFMKLNFAAAKHIEVLDNHKSLTSNFY